MRFYGNRDEYETMRERDKRVKAALKRIKTIASKGGTNSQKRGLFFMALKKELGVK